jgi:beta-lactamase class C
LLVALLVNLPAMTLFAQAQQPKQITYEVKVPVPQAAASSAPAPVLTAPEPVIRPVAEAASVPPRPKVSSNKKAKNEPSAKTQAAATQNPADDDQSATRKNQKSSGKTAREAKTATKNSKATKVATTPAKATTKTNRTKVTATDTDTASRTAVAEKKTLENKAVLAASPPPAAATLAPAAVAPNNHTQATPALATAAAGALVPTALSLDSAADEDIGDLGSQESSELSPETPEPNVHEPQPSYRPLGSANAPLQATGARERFVSEFQQTVEKKIVPYVPGVALAIIADGRVRVLSTYGVKRARSSDLVNTDTLFRLASVSKGFGATAAALLVRDGLVSWDSPVTELLPQVEFSNPRYGNQLTLKNIMSQSTGLPTQANSNFIEEGQSFDEVVRRLRNVSFICPPGKCYNYQNVTYSLIAPIIQKKTGKTYEQYVTDRIFNPLGMHTASFGVAGFKANNNYASPHIGTRKGWAATDVNENYYRFAPAAGINASINDMARWVLAQLGHNPEVLPPMVLNTVQSKVTRNTPAQNHYGSREGVTDSHYGLGWRVFDYRGDKNFVHHGGGVQGFRSEVVFNRELQIGMVVLTNTGRLAGDIIFDFLDAYEDEKRGERRPSAAVKATPKKPVLKKKN